MGLKPRGGFVKRIKPRVGRRQCRKDVEKSFGWEVHIMGRLKQYLAKGTREGCSLVRLVVPFLVAISDMRRSASWRLYKLAIRSCTPIDLHLRAMNGVLEVRLVPGRVPVGMNMEDGREMKQQPAKHQRHARKPTAQRLTDDWLPNAHFGKQHTPVYSGKGSFARRRGAGWRARGRGAGEGDIAAREGWKPLALPPVAVLGHAAHAVHCEWALCP
jgi:hypothetical protein